jgi:hypothetical protein
MSVKRFCTVAFFGGLAFKPIRHLSSSLPIPLLPLEIGKCPRTTRPDAETDRGAIPTNSTIFTSVALSPPEGDVWWEGTRATPPRRTPLSRTRVQQNDLVTFAGHAGTWKVVAPVNGSKADIRRSGGFDIRIVTAPLESITVVQRAGSPGYSY